MTMIDFSRTRTRVWLGIVAVLILALVIWRISVYRSEQAARLNAAAKEIAVDVAPATQTDVPVYRQGLGTVQAFYTVTVTARIDGELQQIAFTEGQNVRKGDLLAQLDPRPARAAYEQAMAAKAKDAAQLANARLDMDRYTVLQPKDLASKQTVDTQHALVDQLTAQVQGDQAAIDNAATQLDYTRITSPINGRTGLRLVDPGNIVHAADTTGIVVVTQLQPIAVIFTLPQEDLAVINAALAAGPVKVTTLSREGNTELEQGTLTLLDNEISPATGTLRLKATFGNARYALWPGQYVNVRVLVSTDNDVVTIPTPAVQLGPTGPYTFVLKADSTAEVRPITLGEQNDQLTVITKGLALGERVIISNQYRLQAGSHVRIAGAPAPKPN
jgi:multidrug efflux system membrane fusion protein